MRDYPRHSPWGDPVSITEIAPGIVNYITDGRAGLWLSPARRRQMNAKFSFSTLTGGDWFEESEDALAVVVAFPKCFTEHTVQTAVHRIRNLFGSPRWRAVNQWMDGQ